MDNGIIQIVRLEGRLERRNLDYISFRRDKTIDTGLVADLYRRSGIQRPFSDLGRIQKMIENSNLIIGAWAGRELVGTARSLTDFSYACYLSDLAVDMAYQRRGIGSELIRLTKEAAGEESMLLLVSAPTAMSYYTRVAPQLGMVLKENAWLIPRKR
jgi:ribosomal protein S18 acetylase RimI-like enzyme